MKKEVIENQLRSTVSNILDIEESSINSDSLLVDNLQIDSLDGVELIMEVEDAFDISITDEEAESVVIFEDLVDMVESKKRK